MPLKKILFCKESILLSLFFLFMQHPILKAAARTRGSATTNTRSSTSRTVASRTSSNHSSTGRTVSRSATPSRTTSRTISSNRGTSTTRRTSVSTTPSSQTPKTAPETQPTPDVTTQVIILSTKKNLGPQDTQVTSASALDITQLSNLFIRTKPNISPEQLIAAQTSMAIINQKMAELQNFITQKQQAPANNITITKDAINTLLSANTVDVFAPPLITIEPKILSGQLTQGIATEQITDGNIDATNLFKVEQFPSLVIISKSGITQYQLDIALPQIPNILSDVTAIKNAITQNQPVSETLISSFKTKVKNLLSTNSINVFVEPYKDTSVYQRMILTGQLSLTNYTVLNAAAVQALTPDQISMIAVISKEGITREKLSSLQSAVINISAIHSGSTQQQVDSVKSSLITLLNQGDIIVMSPPTTIPLVTQSDVVSILQSIPATPPFNVPYIKLLLNTMQEGITYQQAKVEASGIILNLNAQQPYLNSVLGLNAQTDDSTVLSKITPDIVDKLNQIKNWLIQGATEQSLIINIPQNAYNTAKSSPVTTPPSAVAPVVDQAQKAALLSRLNAIDLTAFNPPAIDPYNPTPLPVDKVPTAKLILNSNNAGIKIAVREGLVGNNLIAAAGTAAANILYEQQNLNQYFVTGKDDTTIATNIGQVAWKFQTIINMIINALQKDYITVTFPQ